MRRVSKRARCALILAYALLGGVLAFAGIYFAKAADWIVFPGSPHVYSGVNISAGSVVASDGTALLSNGDSRVYADDAEVRAATLHILGDRDGYIEAPLLSAYADKLIGFDLVNGVYGTSKAGNTMTVTVSAAAEKIAYEQLAGRKGVVAVYNYKTGEILCDVSSPTYDPDNVPDIAGDTTGTWDGAYVDRFTATTYVPGSIFKLVTSTAAIENISDIESQTFNCTGSYDVQGDTITCNGTHGTISFGTALTKSCNVAFGQIAEQLGKSVLTAYAEKAGLNDSLSFDGITCATGNFDLSDAAESDLAWAGIGQYTDLINPCSYLAFVGSIAAGGQAAKPYLVKSVKNSLGLSTYQAKTEKMARTMQASTAATLTQMMRNNVVNNYGAENFPGLTVCAKSGTAEVGGGLEPHATFAGFVTDSAYPLAFLIIVENAGSGSSVCTPIAAAVLAACTKAMDAQ